MKDQLPTDSDKSAGDKSASDKSASAMRVYGVVLTVGVLCSLSIATVYEFTRPIIARNKVAARRQAVLDVLPAASDIGAFRFDAKTQSFRNVPADAADPDLVFVGYRTSGEIVGFAVGARGMGYQDYIRLVYGYSPDQQAIIGIKVLESRETPGLGDRVETEASYLENFQRLDVKVDDESNELVHEIEFVKQGSKTEPWQIDGITGATITSRAISDMLSDSASRWIPAIRSHRDEFQPDGDGA